MKPTAITKTSSYLFGITLLFLFLFCAPKNVNSQEPCEDITSRNMFTYMGSTSDDQASIVGRIGEYGYIVGGYQLAGATRYMYLARLDLCGDVVWQNVYNEGEFGLPTGIVYEDEQIYITAYKGAAYQTTIFELELDGTITDPQIFGVGATYSRRFINTHDNHFATVGTSNSPGGAGANDIYVTKSTYAGTFVWQKKIGNTVNDFGHNIFEDQYDDLVTVGYTRDYLPGIRKGIVIKLDEDGNVLWGREYHNGAGFSHLGFGIEIGGAYYFTGRSNTGTIGGDDGLIIKTDLFGNVIWSKFIGTTGNDQLQAMGEKDGFLYISGTANSDDGGTDVVIMRMNEDGDLLEYTSLGTGLDDVTVAAYVNFDVEADGFYGVSGGNTTEIGGTDYLFYRLDSISTNCLETGVELSIIDAEMTSNVFTVIENTTPWSFSTTSYTSSLLDLEDGIICSDIGDPDPPCEINADFEFVFAGISSEDGATGGCYLNAVQFNDLSTGEDDISSWSWNFGDGDTSDEENPTHTYDAPGTYTITLTIETSPGCFDTYTLTIIMTDGLDFDLIFNQPTCFGFSDGSVTVDVTGGTGELMFTIVDEDGTLLNEDNSNTANTLPTGWYYITVEDDSDCGGVDSVFIDQPEELDIDLSTFNVACHGDQTGSAIVDDVINYTGSYDAISYFWEPNPGGVDGLGADSTGSMGAGNYTVTINDENGCASTFDFVIEEPTELLVDIDFKPALCRSFSYQNGNGIVYGTASGGVLDYTYKWINLETGEEYLNTTWGGLNPGDYEFTVTDENGCMTTETVFLDSINPEAIFSINSAQLNEDCQGTANIEVEFINESINFSNEGDPTADTTFFWNLNSPNGDYEISHDFFYSPDTIYSAKGGTYTVEVCLTVINKNDCQDMACKIITVFEPFIFTDVNIFSPNGDGVNDEFTFEFRSASIADFKCVIVNRWGVVVAELNSITEGWDGTDRNGDKCSNGTYFYKYEATTDNSTKLAGQGTVQLSQ